MPAEAPLFTVIVPVLDGGAAFERCLAALALSRCRDFELVVVDDGCRDASAARASAAGARLLATSGRLGPGAARNLGATVARGRFLFFLDADCEIHHDALERAAARLAAAPGADALIGSYDDDPAAPGTVSQFKNLFHHWVHQRAPAHADTFWGACGVMRRETFESLGGFDAARYLRPSIEDVELGYRLTARGGVILAAPDVQVKHLKRWTLGSLVRTDVFQRGVPWTELLLADRHRPALNTTGFERAIALAGAAVAPALLAALAWPPAALAALALTLFVVLSRLDLYRLFLRRRGPLFALAAVPLHLFYCSYSVAAFALGVLALVRRRLAH